MFAHSNRWNAFKYNVSSELLVQTADLLVSTGLKDVGYTNLVLDDGWQALNRSDDGRPQANVTKFPNGIPPVAQHAHNVGLQFGIYMTNGYVDSAVQHFDFPGD